MSMTFQIELKYLYRKKYIVNIVKKKNPIWHIFHIMEISCKQGNSITKMTITAAEFNYSLIWALLD